MSVKGSKSTVSKVVKKIRKDLVAMKKPISKAAKKVAKDISAVRKPVSKAVKKIAKDISSINKSAAKVSKKVAKTAVKVTKKKVMVAKKKPVAKIVKATKKVVKKAVKMPVKKKSAAKSAKKVSKPVVKKVVKAKKSLKSISKAKPATKKKVVKSKTASAAKAKKTSKKAKAVKKSKSAKEEKGRKSAKPVKKKSVNAISSRKLKQIALTPRQSVKKKSSRLVVEKKLQAKPLVGSVLKSTAKRTIKQPTVVSVVRLSAGTPLMGGAIMPYVEKFGEEYMNEAQQAHFRQLLSVWKDQLINDMVTTFHHMQDEAANFPDPNDRATQEEEFSLELRTRDRELKLIKKIEEAIGKLDNHEYGYCESCGVKIGIRRLEARPTATLCIDCKTLDEIREKQLTG